MDEKIGEIVDNLNDDNETLIFVPHRDATRKRYLFIAEVDASNQYILAITDVLIQDNDIETLKKISKKLIETAKNNINKIVTISSSNISVEEI